MYVAGIDYSTHAVDVVLVHMDDLEPPRWERCHLAGADAWERTRSVGNTPGGWSVFWDNIVAVGIEEPRGQNSGPLYRVQGALLARIPTDRLVQPWVPSAWRKAVGLPGNASKHDITMRSLALGSTWPAGINPDQWPQDAHDAHCIALATRQAITTQAVA